MSDLSKIAYIIPNLPRFIIDEDKFWKWWEIESIPIIATTEYALKSNKLVNANYGEFWDGLTIWADNTHHSMWEVNYKPNDDLFQDLINQIFNTLPWYKISAITLWSNNGYIGYHNDGLNGYSYPVAVRIALVDTSNFRSFQIQEVTTKKTFTPDLTVGPNLFFFNDESNFKHGSTECIGGKKVLVRIDGLLIDPTGLEIYLNNQITNGASFDGI